MNPDHSPFTPNRPVTADFFTGRIDQIEELRSSIRKAAQGDLQVGWIAGERGIGKSSLASLVGVLAEQQENALVAHVHLGGVRTLKGMVGETHLRLLKDNQNKSWGRNLFDLFGKRVKRVGLFGVDIQIDMPNAELTATTNNFVESLGQIVEKAGNDRKVLFLVLDDINGLADSPRFAHWLKSMVDSAATGRTTAPVCLIFVGLEERLDRMKKNNPSVGRIFRPMIHIRPWEQSESEEFFQKAFSRRGVEIKRNDVKLMAEYSGNLPTLAHEIGDAVWRTAKNNKIEREHCYEGIIDAAGSVGKRFIEKAVIRALRSQQYRSILRKIARGTLRDPAKSKKLFEIEFSKAELRSLELTPAEHKAVDNFLTRMKKLGGIVPVQDGRRGVYRFPTYMHGIYFFLEASNLTEKSRE